MKPKLKVKNEAKDWAEALGIDKEEIRQKIVAACSTAFSTSKVLAKAWEEAETFEEAMAIAYLVGLTEGFIRAEKVMRDAKNEIVRHFVGVDK